MPASRIRLEKQIFGDIPTPTVSLPSKNRHHRIPESIIVSKTTNLPKKKPLRPLRVPRLDPRPHQHPHQLYEAEDVAVQLPDPRDPSPPSRLSSLALYTFMTSL